MRWPLARLQGLKIGCGEERVSSLVEISSLVMTGGIRISNVVRRLNLEAC